MEEPWTPQQNQFEPLKNAIKVPIHEIEPNYHTADIKKIEWEFGLAPDQESDFELQALKSGSKNQ